MYVCLCVRIYIYMCTCVYMHTSYTYAYIVLHFPLMQACNAVYAFEILCNMVAYGFMGRNGWFSVSYFHKMEFFILLCTVVEATVVAIVKVEGLTIRPFRLLRIIKLLVTVKAFASVKIILDTLSVGAQQLSVVFLMFSFFLLTLGIFGMQILMYSFRNRCVLDDHMVNGTICASDFSTGWKQTCDFKNPNAAYPSGEGQLGLTGYGYRGAGYDETWCKVYCYTAEECKTWASYGRSMRSCASDCLEQYDAAKRNSAGGLLYPRDRWGRVHSCRQEHAYCSPVGNPKYGLQNFDSIGGVVLSMLQLAVQDSSYSILHQAIQAEPEAYPAIWIFCVISTVICTWLMLGLFVAVVTGTFERVRENYRITRVRNAAVNETQEETFDGTHAFSNDARFTGG